MVRGSLWQTVPLHKSSLGSVQVFLKGHNRLKCVQWTWNKFARAERPNADLHASWNFGWKHTKNWKKAEQRFCQKWKHNPDRFFEENSRRHLLLLPKIQDSFKKWSTDVLGSFVRIWNGSVPPFLTIFSYSFYDSSSFLRTIYYLKTVIQTGLISMIPKVGIQMIQRVPNLWRVTDGDGATPN